MALERESLAKRTPGMLRAEGCYEVGDVGVAELGAMSEGCRIPILFLLGPSGTGKSTLGIWAQEDLGLLHLEIDRWPNGDGIDLAQLRDEWNRFWSNANAEPLATTLRARSVAAGNDGAILTFPGNVILQSEHIRAARLVGISVVVLYGTGAECLESFLARERLAGRGLSADHWIANNQSAYAELSRPEVAGLRMLAFSEGRHRSRESLIRDLHTRMRTEQELE